MFENRIMFIPIAFSYPLNLLQILIFILLFCLTQHTSQFFEVYSDANNYRTPYQFITRRSAPQISTSNNRYIILKTNQIMTSIKREHYKEYFKKGGHLPRSTKYDHKKRKRDLDSSSSSCDEQELHNIVNEKYPKFVGNSHNKVSVDEFERANNDPETEISICDRISSEAFFAVAGSKLYEPVQFENISDDEQFDVEDYEKPLPMNIRVGDFMDDSSTAFSENETNYDSDDSEAEQFWRDSEDKHFSELKKKLKNGDLDEISHANLIVSPAEMLCAIQNYCSHYELPTIAMESMCKMFNTFISSPVLPDTKYHIDKLLRCDDKTQFHAVCPHCEVYLRPFNLTERTVFCEKCKREISVKGNDRNFFEILDIEKKLKHLLETYDEYYDSVLLRNQEKLLEKTTDIHDIYDGVEYKKFVSSLPHELKNAYVTCTMNTDGSPIWKSSNDAIWPVQIMLHELPPEVRSSNTVTAALWVGKKPNMNILIDIFAKNVNAINEEGVNCKIVGNCRKIRLYPICCCADAVARAPVQGVVQYNGYYGCNWCLHPGVPIKKKKKKVVKYPLLEYVPEKRCHSDTVKLMRTVSEKKVTQSERTKEKQTKKETYGVKTMSPLILLLYFNVVSGFVPDEMHCVYLGVYRQFAQMWFDQMRLPYSLKDKIPLIDAILLKIQAPNLVTRLTRSLKDRKFWKSREWENWLFFYSLLILKCIPGFGKYARHWQLLVEAMHILKSSPISKDDFARADRLLKKFVADTELLYGRSAMTYNVHQLLHLVESVKNWGPLQCHTGYPFEAGNGKILRMVKSTKGVLHQLCRKIEYQNSAILLKEHISKYYKNSRVLKFVSHLKTAYTVKCVNIGENKYFGTSDYPDTKWVRSLNLDQNFTKSYEKLLKNDCIFSSCNKENVRSNNSYIQTKTGLFMKVNQFLVDELSETEYALCNRIKIKSTFKNCEKIKKIVEVQKELDVISTNDIKRIAVCVKTSRGQYISAVPHMLHY